MTEVEWLNSNDPCSMLNFVRMNRLASERKLRLTVLAACRAFWQLLPDKESRDAVEIAERLVDGKATARECVRVHRAAKAAADTRAMVCGPFPYDYDVSCMSEVAALASDPNDIDEALAALMLYVGSDQLELAACLRDIFGNVFHPVAFNPAILSWNDATVVLIAHAIYDERAFDRLPILADALEDAGCTEPQILEHCRGSGAHVRGCWVVDGLLGKRESN